MMEAYEIIKNSRLYLDYLEEHIKNVEKAFNKLIGTKNNVECLNDSEFLVMLKESVSQHDLSKFTKEEFVQYREKFYGGIDEPAFDFDAAWINHYTNNHHHIETYKTIYDTTTKLNIIHMVIDWTAMGYKFGDTARAFYESDKMDKKVHDEDIDFLYKIFEVIE